MYKNRVIRIIQNKVEASNELPEVTFLAILKYYAIMHNEFYYNEIDQEVNIQFCRNDCLKFPQRNSSKGKWRFVIHKHIHQDKKHMLSTTEQRPLQYLIWKGAEHASYTRQKPNINYQKWKLVIMCLWVLSRRIVYLLDKKRGFH